MPNEDLAADLYDLTVFECETAGLAQYEVSNFARPGSESQHNLIYWRCGEYAGIGPGAHGRLVDSVGQRWATEAIWNPNQWLDCVENGSGQEQTDVLDTQQQSDEFILMGLRLMEGVSLQHYEEIAGQPISKGKLEALIDEDVVKIADGNLIVKKQYVKLLNSVLYRLQSA